MPSRGPAVIVFDRTLPRTVARGSNTLATYLDEAPSFEAAVQVLDAAMATPDGRDAAVRLFSPASAPARRFLNSLRALHATDTGRASERAKRVLLAVLLGGHAPTGRKPVRLSDDARVRIAGVRAVWLAAVQVCWEGCADDRSAVVDALAPVAEDRHQTWATAQKRELRARAVKRWTRPLDLAEVITAWECGVPIRHVRLAIRHRSATVTHA